MRYVLSLLIITLFSAVCQTNAQIENRRSASQTRAGRELSQTVIKFDTGNPNIKIESYTLIAENPEKHRREAEAIMQLKKNFPLAVQTKDRVLFERILARDFVFRGEPGMLRRAEYIKERTDKSQGEILRVVYENIALQFFGDIGVMTYRNILRGTDEKGNPDPPEYISWADIYVKENGEWKIGSVHVIDYRMEKSGSALEAEALKLNREYGEMIQRNDLEAIDKILADDYLYTDQSGKLKTKADNLASFKNRQVKITSFEMLEEKARGVDENTVIVHAKMRFKGESNGKPFDLIEQATTTFVFRGGRWQVVSDHLSFVKE